MKNMKINRLTAIAVNAAFAAAVALGASSCVKEDVGGTPTGAPLEKVNVTLQWSVSDMNAGDDATREAMAAEAAGGTAKAATGVTGAGATRVIPPDMDQGGAFDDDNPIVQNMWVLQFDGNTPQSKFIGATFLASTDLAVSNPNLGNYPHTVTASLIKRSSPAYTVFVANVSQGASFTWGFSLESTFADVISVVKTITDDNGAWENISPVKTLMMSGITNTTVDVATPLTFDFTRNVARVTLNLSIDNPDITVSSVRLRNVSNRIIYAAAAVGDIMSITPQTVFPVNAILIDYPAITTGMPTNGTPAKFSWYLPRNQEGTSMSTSAKEKTRYAPMNAVYLEILATKGGARPTTGVIRVYPGADEISDYNLLPNSRYTINLTISDIGNDPIDSRVQALSNVVDYTWAKTSNSFILNPLPATTVGGGAARTFNIPISQVNRYWGGTAEGYGNNPANVIGAADAWTVSLIWSDLAGQFDNAVAVNATAVSLTKNTGIGPGDFFTLSVPAGRPAGNFLIGIKKGGAGNWLWSWHFWITDYQPDTFNKARITDGTYTYAVPGGQVERYGSPASGNNLWSPGPMGVYAQSVMMDRSLGAVENYFTTQPANANRGNLHYQWGRKDPFPASALAAGGAVTAITNGDATTAIPISTSVINPTLFYVTVAGVANDWTNVDGTGVFLWHDPNAPMTGTGKSIYDPCPPGWQMPLNGTWNDFNRTDAFTGGYINTQNDGRGLGWANGRGIGTGAAVNGLRYWPGATLTDPVAGRIWFPATGNRSYSSGALGSVGSSGYYWSATPYSATSGYYLAFYSGAVYPSYYYSRSSGFVARCVAE